MLSMTLSEDEIKRRVVDLLQKRVHQDMSINEIENLVGINRNTISKYLAVFCAEGIIIRSRMVGKAKFFRCPLPKKLSLRC
jgi:predicted transcriptional regulator